MALQWYEEGKHEYYSCLRAREIKIPLFGKHSPQLTERPAVVKWVQYVASAFCLHRPTEHLAMALVDLFMDYFAIGKEQLLLMAISAVTIAAKCEEQEIYIPRPQQLMDLLPDSHSYKLSLCLQMELKMLRYFNWNVVIPTTAHFIDYLMIEAFSDVFGVDGQFGHKTDRGMVTIKDIKLTIDLLHSIVLQDIEYRSPMPSLIASIMIYITRLYHAFQDPWNIRLHKLTGYNYQDFTPSLVSKMMDGLSDPVIFNSNYHDNVEVILMSTSEPNTPIKSNSPDHKERPDSCSVIDSGYDSNETLTPPTLQFETD